MQKIKRNRLVFSDFQNRPLTRYKVPKYTFKTEFMQIRKAEKIFNFFIRNLRQKLGKVTLWSFPPFSLYTRYREGGYFLMNNPV
jgi:hypothetical protein